MYICYKLIQQLRKAIRLAPGEEQEFKIEGAGCLFFVFKRMFRLIDR